MGSHGKGKRDRSGRQKKRRDESESGSESESYTSDSDGSDDLSPPRSSRRKKGSSSRRTRRRSSSDDSSDSDGGRKSKKRSSSKDYSEEKVTEYMSKKAQKKALRAAKKLKTQSVSGYSNDSNPFGDSNLTETFVWRKKIEKDVHRGVPLEEFSVKAEKRRHRERMTEVEKVKKRREERAVEKARHEEEMALLARERARAEFHDWEKKEEEFHFDQSKVRSEIRLREGRLKPIDVLCKHLDGSDDLDIELSEPYMVFKKKKVRIGIWLNFQLSITNVYVEAEYKNDSACLLLRSRVDILLNKGLTVKDMEELRDDIKMYLDLDRATPTRVQYWEALIVVCDWELAEARKRDALDRARVRGEEPPAELLAQERGLHAGVEADVRKLLDGKTHAELVELQLDIESQLRSGSAKVVEYWEAVLKRLEIYKAKACLKEIHAEMLRRHLHRLEQLSEGEDDVEVNPGLTRVVEENEEEINDTNLSDAEEAFSPEPVAEEEEADEAAEAAGSFSPELMHGDDREEAIDPEEDKKLLQMKRMIVLEKQKKRLKEAMDSKPAPVEDNLELKAMKAMGAMEEGDAIFGSNAEVNLDSEVYWWHDKYRPRKPKYFNRVHTGYEWNKYNQTHYDHDNPPPKIVQGYKFNIFYPDLVDKIKAPIYTIEKDGTSAETCMIRFHAGPPYEDIAFRIVNKEWEYSHKKGFKCTFERGILHLYFNFKRHRYRR
ncbi:Cactin [Arabidopsis thaliana]|uniref:Splicing factor Cactin n=1 Tax=Arabidopsis thaliana TaxID=3702 RepID=CATIN_ARATH|nr:cactus-binding carboxy-terminal, cactin [Arabidopsis thaliana]F4I2J8.1 RecName: Full=Splicing factor Cactin [Arabidopsis thaliana]AEE27633.1 cactus-binding carboxy-terminal, cactin [Arabidopsis thaliana]|eukprot:NP_001184904.1 cactus-binding carboxy-terminal, cactin [Arabidopsis thaliana]